MTKKRAVKPEQIDVEETNFFENLEKEVNATNWEYKSNNADNLQLRDHALVSALILTGLRISELLPLKKEAFKDHKKTLVLFSIPTLKHGKTRQQISIPKTGGLSPLTRILEGWLAFVPTPDSYVFASGTSEGFSWNAHIQRQRAHQIIYTTTGKFPHLYRGIHESIYGRLVFGKDPWKLKEYMGLWRLDSTTPYVGAPWMQDLDKTAKLGKEEKNGI